MWLRRERLGAPASLPACSHLRDLQTPTATCRHRCRRSPLPPLWVNDRLFLSQTSGSGCCQILHPENAKRRNPHDVVIDTTGFAETPMSITGRAIIRKSRCGTSWLLPSARQMGERDEGLGVAQPSDIPAGRRARRAGQDGHVTAYLYDALAGSPARRTSWVRPS